MNCKKTFDPILLNDELRYRNEIHNYKNICKNVICSDGGTCDYGNLASVKISSNDHFKLSSPYKNIWESNR